MLKSLARCPAPSLPACVLSCFSRVQLCAILWTVPTRLLCPGDSPGKNTGVGCHALLQRLFPTQGSDPSLLHLLHWLLGSSPLAPPGKVKVKSLSRVWLFATPWTVAYQAPLSLGFSRQEYWSGLPFPSPGDLPDPGMEPGLPHCRQMLYRPGKPLTTSLLTFSRHLWWWRRWQYWHNIKARIKLLVKNSVYS